MRIPFRYRKLCHRRYNNALTEPSPPSIAIPIEMPLAADEKILRPCASVWLAPALPAMTTPPLPTQPWEHLIYAYLLENTGMFRIFRKVVELYAVGEALEVPTDIELVHLRVTPQGSRVHDLILAAGAEATVTGHLSVVHSGRQRVVEVAYRLVGVDSAWLPPRAVRPSARKRRSP